MPLKRLSRSIWFGQRDGEIGFKKKKKLPVAFASPGPVLHIILFSLVLSEERSHECPFFFLSISVVTLRSWTPANILSLHSQHTHTQQYLFLIFLVSLRPLCIHRSSGPKYMKITGCHGIFSRLEMIGCACHTAHGSVVCSLQIRFCRFFLNEGHKNGCALDRPSQGHSSLLPYMVLLIRVL